MTAMVDYEVDDLRRANAELQRILDERTRERDEALDRETATGDVLNVINSSPGDLVPVFDTILQKAIRLCEAAFGILWTYDGELFHAVAFCNVPPLYAEVFREPHRAGPLTGLGRVAGGEPFAHITDMLEDDAYRTGDPMRRAGIDLAGARTHLSVPLRKDGVLVGNFAVFRKEVRPFTDKQIALVQNFAAQAVIAMENARLLGELRQRTGDLQEALEYQTATSDVLKVISRSTFDLQSVLDTLAETAARLCDAGYSAIFRRDGEVYRVAAVVAFSPETTDAARKFQTFLEQHPLVPGRGSITGRVVLEGRAVHVADTASDPEYTISEATTLGNLRTQLGVPLLREGEPVGVIVVARQRVEPFTERQVELVHTFADQAVIAMENARLITETREALEQQTATAEVLQVINSSPGELQPVFEAILEKAHSLCGVSYGSLQLYDGEKFRAVAVHSLSGALADRLRQGYSPGPTNPVRRLLEGERFVHTPDLAEIDDPITNSVVELLGTRTLLCVALRNDKKLLGLIAAVRLEVRPFSDKQITLLESFAAQAVIAMENARLITETREALEQQTATAEVLQVINSSPGDLAPVFEAILEKAHTLCGATKGSLVTVDGAQFRTVATRGLSEPYAAILREAQHNPNLAGTPWGQRRAARSSGSAPDRMLKGASLVHLLDARDSEFAVPRAAADLEGVRTIVYVPLRKDSALLGYITAYREEVRPFSDKQIALLQNFSAQAVIAMENARLITETREALEQQTATAEVLQVINSSPGDLTPVFEAMLDKAMHLCAAAFGYLMTYDGEYFQAIARRGLPPPFAEYLLRMDQPGSSGAYARIKAGAPLVHIVDLMEGEVYQTSPLRQALVNLGGARTGIVIALRKDDALLGVFTIYRQEVRPFGDKQIALLENFAAQAVIAMENARLLGELHQRTSDLQESLEYQTATGDVLKLISRSGFDLQPVLVTLAETAARLCSAEMVFVYRRDGEVYRLAANCGFPPEYEAFVRNTGGFDPRRRSDSVSARAALLGRAVHVHDVAAEPGYRSEGILLGKIRTGFAVPLLREGVPIGVLGLARQRVEPFTEKQIELVTTFADQAAIAIENTRLITETQEALDQQTATSEVLQVINSSPGDLMPVFDTILEKAHTLCGADHGHLTIYNGEHFRAVAFHGVPYRFAEMLRQPFRPAHGIGERLLAGEPFIQIPDMAALIPRGDDEIGRAAVEIGRIRTLLFVPLRKDKTLLGHITAHREEVRTFSQKEIALLQNFAEQAVIAMENARLITETREALEQQTATAEVLQVINSSPGDLAPVFDAMLERAMRLCDAAFGLMRVAEGVHFRTVSARGVPAAYAEFLIRNPEPAGQGGIAARSRDGEPFVHTIDLKDDERYRRGVPTRRAMVDLGGARTSLSMALRRDQDVLGTIHIYRQEVRPFTDKQIALLQNFAAQAVIAMENARLITETHEALEQQTATAEVLQVINSSPGNLQPVFDAMLDKALGLCGADFGVLWTYDGERIHATALRGVPPTFAEYLTRTPHSVGPDNAHGRLLRGEPVVHIADISEDEAYSSGDPIRRTLVELGGGRTLVAVPLRKDETFLGDFVIYRQEVRPFSDKQIALLQNFAAQAVIAIENARLLDEIRQRQAELRVTFDNMADGVAMFDEDLKLTAWNRNFQEILDVADAVLAQRPSYAEYLRILADRGEFGTEDIEAELSRRLDEIDQELRLERTRPDGRVIEVRRNAVPDGGFVLIYSDITERKRSEAEIRAARDAAEAAYRDLKTAQASLIQTEKMASLGQLTAGIAHEIKNPLNFVNNFAGLSVELLDELKETAAPAITGLDDHKRAEIDETIEMLTGNLEKIAEHGRRADNIVKSMLEHSRGSSGERRSVDLNALIEEALNLAYHGARAQDQSFNITLERDYAQAVPPIELVPQDITRVCLNLFTNGFYATTKRQREEGDGSFKPSLRVSTRDLGEAVEVRIRDNGIGIPTEIKDKLFQPFFTTKPTGEGTGLGLSISYDIVTQQHGGTIAVDSRLGEFTEFTVRLPRAYRATMAEAAS